MFKPPSTRYSCHILCFKTPPPGGSVTFCRHGCHRLKQSDRLPVWRGKTNRDAVLRPSSIISAPSSARAIWRTGLSLTPVDAPMVPPIGDKLRPAISDLEADTDPKMPATRAGWLGIAGGLCLPSRARRWRRSFASSSLERAPMRVCGCGTSTAGNYREHIARQREKSGRFIVSRSEQEIALFASGSRCVCKRLQVA